MRSDNWKYVIQSQGPNASNNGESPILLQYNEKPANDNILHTDNNVWKTKKLISWTYGSERSL
jgi:hypothetical protein